MCQPIPMMLSSQNYCTQNFASHPTARCSTSKYAIHISKHHPFFRCHHPPSHWSFSPDFSRLFAHRRAQQRQLMLMRSSFKCPMWSVRGNTVSSVILYLKVELPVCEMSEQVVYFSLPDGKTLKMTIITCVLTGK